MRRSAWGGFHKRQRFFLASKSPTCVAYCKAPLLANPSCFQTCLVDLIRARSHPGQAASTSDHSHAGGQQQPCLTCSYEHKCGCSMQMYVSGCAAKVVPCASGMFHTRLSHSIPYSFSKFIDSSSSGGSAKMFFCASCLDWSYSRCTSGIAICLRQAPKSWCSMHWSAASRCRESG